MTFTSDKIVHVNAYQRDDGTQVKEHYRGRGPRGGIQSGGDGSDRLPEPWEGTIIQPEDKSNPLNEILKILGLEIPDKIYMNASPVISGGVSVDVFPPIDFSSVLGAIISVGSIALSASMVVGQVAAKLYAASLTADKAAETKLKPQLMTSINEIKNTHQLSKKVEEASVKQLVNTKNQQEYSELYKTYTEQKQLNETNSKIISKIEHAAENSDYETVLNELKNYRSNFDEVVAKNKIYRPLNTGNSIDNYPQKKVNIPIKYTNMTIPKNFTPKEAKIFINRLLPIYSTFKRTPETKAFWQASSSDFEKSKSYIETNGNLIYSTTGLPTKELQSIVTNKLQDQLGIKDTMGVIFSPDSSTSKAIVESPEIKKHFVKHAKRLLNGEIIKQDSTYFASKDLATAYGHADILYTYIDKSGNLNSIVFDTYDFNEFDPDWKVQIARIAQEGKVIQNYYTLNIIKIPFKQWILWFYGKNIKL